ncbi:transcription elongation factor SPT5-like [Symsagittifera roscoffensis]|uniref:transcription elongation factor SPT5-like n=1 Tax=Symsagittifera roscoffensis TaxID=84072 RepID=UPI00307CC445
MSDSEEETDTRGRGVEDEAEEASSDELSGSGSDEPEGEDTAERSGEEEEEDIEEYYKRNSLNQRPPKKKKKRNQTGFILDEADVNTDDEDEEDEAEDGYEKARHELDERNAMMEKQTEHARKARAFMEEVERGDAANLGRYFSEKYANVRAEVDEEEVLPEVSQQALLPGVKDPNLWLVRCNMGREKETCLLLMRKFLAMESQAQRGEAENGEEGAAPPEPLQIKSVVAVEGLKGYIYVEAYKQQHVKQAIANINALDRGQWKQAMVPIHEMVDVLRVVKDSQMIKKGSWVRLKRTVFRGDLAQVMRFDPQNNTVDLKLIPRIDYTKFRGIMRESNTGKRKLNNNNRPPQKLFDPEKIKKIGGEYARDGDTIIFEGNRYSTKGFLYKQFRMNAIVTDGVEPGVAELEKFEESVHSIEVNAISSKGEIKQNLAVGDNVQVIEGDLKNLEGKIVKIENGKATMMPKHEDLKDALEFSLGELCKCFKEGDHVKVISGAHEGDTGLIVRVDEDWIVVLSDLSRNEMKVLPRDMQLCSDMSSGVDSAGIHQLGDLVKIDASKVGVIVRVEKEHFRVLDNMGKVEHLPHQAVQKMKYPKHNNALDCDDNQLKAGNIVEISEGRREPYKGKICYLFKNAAFISVKDLTENAGFMVCKPRRLKLSGTDAPIPVGQGAMPMEQPGYMSPKLSSPSHPSQAHKKGVAFSPGQTMHGQMMLKRDTSLIGQTIRITRGPYKSYVGIVKDATDALARVELHTSCQTISVDKSRIALLNQPKGGATDARVSTPAYNLAKTPSYMTHGSRTPMHGGMTPSYGAMTPSYGSMTPSHEFGNRTPHYGSMTPAHDGSMTPGRANAWDPTNPNTPARFNEFEYSFDEGATSPTGHIPGTPAGAMTPGAGGMTPGYDSNHHASTLDPARTPGGNFSPFSSHHGAATPAGMSSFRGSPYATSPSAYSPAMNSPASPSYSLTSEMRTPGGGPGTGSDLDGVPHSEWVSVNIHVLDRSSGGQAVVQKILQPNEVQLKIVETGKIIQSKMTDLEPAQPAKGDIVKVLHGEKKGQILKLVNQDGPDGILQPWEPGANTPSRVPGSSMTLLPLWQLAKVVV